MVRFRADKFLFFDREFEVAFGSRASPPKDFDLLPPKLYYFFGDGALYLTLGSGRCASLKPIL